jgi:hypothetical protein
LEHQEEDRKIILKWIWRKKFVMAWNAPN